MDERKHYLDNIRWITIVLVIIYHIIYIFNCSGVISNINVQGIPILDSYLIFVYPWFMCLLFVVAGISSRYSLQKRTNKEFLKDRRKRILIPSIIGIFLYGWISSFITSKYTDMFAGNGDMIPSAIKYFIYCLMGIGPLWFCHILFIACVLLVIIRKIDKKDKIWELGKKTNYLILFVLTLLVWLSSLILNTPLIMVYRFGIYLFMFFLGYFVFSHNEVLEKLKKISIPMGIISLIMGIMYVIYYYGTNYTDNSCLQSLFTNTYLWISILAILGLGQKFLNFNNKFSNYMTKNNFNFYVLHYTIIVVLGYLVVTYLKLPFILNYFIILLGTIIILPILVEIIKRIPIINKLVLGTK
jgi:hypothetical protein